MNVINPTIRMWKNRLSRIAGAWSDPDQPRREPSISWVSSWWYTILVAVAILIYFIYGAVQAETWLKPAAEVLKLEGMFLAIFIIAYFVGRPHAVFKDELGDHQAGFWWSTIICGLLGWFILFVFIDTKHEAQPVTQAVYDQARREDPGCNRYQAYRDWRTDKNELFDINDLKRARQECIDTREKNDLMAKQKALK
jgi:hypothetical protein